MSVVNSNNFLHKTVDGVKQFFSPLVNAATVVRKDGTRLEQDGVINADDSKKLDGKEPSEYDNTNVVRLYDAGDTTKNKWMQLGVSENTLLLAGYVGGAQKAMFSAGVNGMAMVGSHSVYTTAADHSAPVPITNVENATVSEAANTYFIIRAGWCYVCISGLSVAAGAVAQIRGLPNSVGRVNTVFSANDGTSQYAIVGFTSAYDQNSGMTLSLLSPPVDLALFGSFVYPIAR